MASAQVYAQDAALHLEARLQSLLPRRQVDVRWDGRRPSSMIAFSFPELAFDVYQRSADVFDDATQPCATLVFQRETPESKYNLYLHSLKHRADQRGCTLSGGALLDMIKGLYPTVVRRITLDDEATLELLGVDITLTPLRKFMSGQGWYESHGFGPREVAEQYRHQESFDRLRNAEFDAVRMLVWHVVWPNRSDWKAMRQSGKESTEWKRALVDIAHAFDLIPQHTTLDLKLHVVQRWVNKKTNKAQLREFLKRYGVPFGEYEDVTRYRKPRSGDRLVPASVRKPLCKCATTVLVPGAMRRILDKVVASSDEDVREDAKQHLIHVGIMLELMQVLTILYVPDTVVYPARMRQSKVEHCQSKTLPCASEKRGEGR